MHVCTRVLYATRASRASPRARASYSRALFIARVRVLDAIRGFLLYCTQTFLYFLLFTFLQGGQNSRTGISVFSAFLSKCALQKMPLVTDIIEKGFLGGGIKVLYLDSGS